MRYHFLLFLCLVAVFAQAQNVHVIPTPQEADLHLGSFRWDDQVLLTYDASDAEISQIVTMFRHDLEQINPQKVHFARGVAKGKRYIELTKTDHLNVPENQDQAYRLTIGTGSIRMEALSSTGLFYATQSLKQIYRHAMIESNGTDISLPCMTITDWPNFKIRAWQDDISRGPIVKMEYLKRIIPQMAECKLNAFSLYTEHTFKTRCHPDIAPADAFTVDEIRELEDFCRPYHIQIIGNQQCFGHFEEILCNPFYSHLADTKWNLNPALPETYRFLEDHLREVARTYKSPYFNINCDETESLGKGTAKAYVDSIGAETVYYQHVNRVNRMLRPYRKRVMMWGDIADQHPEIIENLDKDLFFIAWSYVAKDNFDGFLKPYVASGHKFFVAPGVSLSERVWPKHYEFKSNITNLCRSAYKAGALGVINTCWDDFGESLSNCALYGLVLGAEMSWNPLKKTDAKALAKERALRQTETDFAIHYFGTSSTEPLQHLDALSDITKMDEIGKFSAMTESLTAFYPAWVGDNFVEANEQAIVELIDLEAKLEADKKIVKKNATVIGNALYAVHRMEWCAWRNLLRCQLYEAFNDPTEENINDCKEAAKALTASLHKLKNEYIGVWNQESRPYWLDVNMKKYDDIAKELQQLEYQPFIDIVSDTAGRPAVALRTLFGDCNIHYTTDGKQVAQSDPAYTSPLRLSEPTLVKAACFDATGQAVGAERYFSYHKAMGRLKRLNSPAGNYSPEYSGGGDGALLDGILGSDDYKDGHWQGFYGTDADIEIDLGKWTKVNTIDIGFLVNAHDWILCPTEVRVYAAFDGKNYALCKTLPITGKADQDGNTVFRQRFDIGIATRILRIVVKNAGKIPEGYPGTGYDSWIFMDEVMVE